MAPTLSKTDIPDAVDQDDLEEDETETAGERDARTQRKLDRSLEETFPASDPAPTSPGAD